MPSGGAAVRTVARRGESLSPLLIASCKGYLHTTTHLPQALFMLVAG